MIADAARSWRTPQIRRLTLPTSGLQNARLPALGSCAGARTAVFRAKYRPQRCVAHAMHGAVSKRHFASRSNRDLAPMATELLIAGLTVVLYAACALFVRICDRI